MSACDKSKSGSVLMVVMSVMVVLTIAMTSIMKTSLQHSYSTELRLDSETAFYAAQSGIEVAATYIADNISYMPSYYANTGTISSATYVYSITNTNYKTYKIYAEGVCGDVTRAIEMTQVCSATYAQFSLWSVYNGSLYFTSDEEFGSVHSDSELYFSTSGTNGATFWGEVTSLADSYVISGDIDYVNFTEGFELSTTNGSMSELDFDAYETLASNYGYLYEGETTVTFNSNSLTVVVENGDGTTTNTVAVGDEDILIYITAGTESTSTTISTNVTSSTSTSGHGKNTTTTTTYTTNVVTTVTTNTYDGTLTVEGGTLDGRVTIVAEDDITITDDIVYAVLATPYDDTDEESDDALGLISGANVVISTASAYDSDGLNINASIIASGTLDSDADGSFYVDSYSSGIWRGYINLVGGIAQDTRGAVGTFSTVTGDGTSGYSKNYVYDSRFSTTPPPYYPAVSYDLTYDTWAECTPVGIE
jgi:hypothetical protein